MAEMVLDQTIILSDQFRDLLKRQQYEEIILRIIRKSNKLFQGREFTQILNQSNGESDFVDDQGNKYDAKLLITTKQGQLLGDRKNELTEWIKSLQMESAEFSTECIKKRNISNIKKTAFYGIVRDRIQSLKDDENGMLFIPFPIVLDDDGFFSQFTTDIISATYGEIDLEGLVGDRSIYFIYPGSRRDIYVLRSGKGVREYIKMPELAEHVMFETFLN